ncbi:MAG: heme-binding protein [Steroidobacteraceae bacterium]
MKSSRLIMLLVALHWSFLAMAAEEPAYRIVERSGAFEIRDYESMTIAETLVREDFDAAGNSAFRTLFGYISGKNESQQKIAMTAPVRQQAEPDGGFRVGFVAPAHYSLQTAPKPADSRIVLRQLPPQRVAVMRYSGRWTEKNYREHEAALLAWLASRTLATAGPVVYARYNAPFVPWPMRRNEVLAPLAVGPAGP